MSSEGIVAQASWASARERGARLIMRLTALGLKLMARPITTPLVHLVALYFFLCSPRTRALSRDYLRRVEQAFPARGIRSTPRFVYGHVSAFAHAIRDKLDAWAGRLKYTQITFTNHPGLSEAAMSRQGILVIGSHLGNVELCRALAHHYDRVRLNVLVHTRHVAHFNEMLRASGATEVELFQVTDLDAATALKLKQRIERGEWVVIAGDRVPVHGGRTVDVDFLGGRAPLPVGPYVMAALLEAPVYLLFCLRHRGRNHVYFERFSERIRWRRAERDAVLAREAQRFADRLAHYLELEPLQWFNFYPFWRA